MNKDVKKLDNGDFEVVDQLPTKPTPLLQPYKYDPDAVSLATGLYCPEPTLTQQNTAEQTDINYIVAQFNVTGYLPQANKLPTYGDFSQVNDFREALELIQKAEDAFNSLPADARAHFSNNPADFLDFMENGPDGEILASLGLADLIPQKDESPSPITNT